MNATLKTKKNTNGTYSYVVLVDGERADSWTATQAVTPWGARAQGAKALKTYRDAFTKMAAVKAPALRYTEDFEPVR